MSPSTLLADPSLRFAGVQFRAHPSRQHRIAIGGRNGRRSAPRRRLRWSWLALAAVLALAGAGLAYLRVWPPLATVMSASMAPTIQTGDIVVLKKLDHAAQVGDIVAVSVPEGIRRRYGYPPIIIHRIVRIDGDGVVSTKGDAYKDPDPFTVPPSALTTRVVASLPAAGRILAFLASPLGLLWLVGGGVLLLGMPLLERHRAGQRCEQDSRLDLQSALLSVTQELTLLRLERDRDLDAAAGEAAIAQEQLRAANASLSWHLQELPAQIERAVAAAIAAFEPPPAPPPPPPAPSAAATPTPERTFVAASQWRPPASTPDLMGVLRRPDTVTSAWDALPSGVEAVRTGRFKTREEDVDLRLVRSS